MVAAGAGGCGQARPSPGSGSAPGEAVGAVASAIQGGEETTSNTFSVALSDKRKGNYCTGTLIAPNLVLTARHCVDKVAGGGNILCANATFSDPSAAEDMSVLACPDIFNRCQDRFDVETIYRTPGNNVCGGDLALLLLKTAIPTSVATLATPNVRVPVYDRTINRTITAVGYGATQPDGQGFGKRRIRQSIGVFCVSHHPNTTYDCFNEGDLPTVGNDEFVTEEGTCEGDSGLGAIEQASFNAGTPLILGTYSRGGAEGNKCVAGVFTRVDVWKSLVAAVGKEASRRGGYDAPLWTKPVGDDGKTPVAAGDLAAGSACTDDFQCGSGVCAKKPDKDESVCATPCDSDGACSEGFECLAAPRKDWGDLCIARDVPALTADGGTADGGGTTGGGDSGGCAMAAGASAGGGEGPSRDGMMAVMGMGLLTLLAFRAGARPRRAPVPVRIRRRRRP